MCVRWKASRDCAAIDKWLELPRALLAMQWAIVSTHSRFLYRIVVNNLIFSGLLLLYYLKSSHCLYNLRILTFLLNLLTSYYDEFSCSELSGTRVRRKLRRIGETGTGEERDCPARKEEDDGLALSEARLCVNVWLAFGRQPWQIALLGWQPGSLSTRNSHLTAATHRVRSILLRLLFFFILLRLLLSTRGGR